MILLPLPPRVRITGAHHCTQLLQQQGSKGSETCWLNIVPTSFITSLVSLLCSPGYHSTLYVVQADLPDPPASTSYVLDSRSMLSCWSGFYEFCLASICFLKAIFPNGPSSAPFHPTRGCWLALLTSLMLPGDSIWVASHITILF